MAKSDETADARKLDWGIPNVRDLGGLEGRWGVTRFGRVARGPRRELLSEAGWDEARRWGLATVVDLRGSSETGRRDGDPSIGPSVLDGITVVSAPTEDHDNAEFREICFPILDSPEYWPHNLRILPHLVLATLTAIAAARPGVLVHCSAGRDRTGLVSALLLANAGVAPEAVADDYAASVMVMAGVSSHSPTHDGKPTETRRKPSVGPEIRAPWWSSSSPMDRHTSTRWDSHPPRRNGCGRYCSGDHIGLW